MTGWDPDSVARLVYAGLLLAFLFGIVAWRRNLTRSLRDLAIWGLIFGMVILLYSFRDRLRDELMPAAMVETEGGTIELRRARDGHFHATLTVNGAPIRFMVDTGASDVVLSRADARRAGIDPDALAYMGRARTANGTIATARVRLDTVALGDLTDRGIAASVTDGGLETSLLGLSYLNRFSSIEISGDRMRLVR